MADFFQCQVKHVLQILPRRNKLKDVELPTCNHRYITFSSSSFFLVAVMLYVLQYKSLTVTITHYMKNRHIRDIVIASDTYVDNTKHRHPLSGYMWVMLSVLSAEFFIP